MYEIEFDLIWNKQKEYYQELTGSYEVFGYCAFVKSNSNFSIKNLFSIFLY